MRLNDILLALGLLALFVLMNPALVGASDTASCQGKRQWQRSIVRTTVHRWFQNDSRPDDLLALVQAEQGIVACRAGAPKAVRLHTTRLPRGLEVGQLGAVLLANELEWSGLMAAPEEGLAGEWFPVRTVAAGSE